jgi:hypothetical protein
MSGCRAGFAETGPGVSGAGVGTRPRCGPGACPRARPAESITASGRLAVTPAARAGSPLRTSQGHHGDRAAHVVTLWHRQNPGRPGQHAWPGPSPGRARAPARVFAPAILAGPAGKVPASGQLAGLTVSTPARSVTGWPQQAACAAPGQWQARHAQPRGQDDAGHCEVVQRRQRLRLHRGRGRPGRIRAHQRDHRWRLPQPGGRAEGRVRHHPGPEGTQAENVRVSGWAACGHFA